MGQLTSSQKRNALPSSWFHDEEVTLAEPVVPVVLAVDEHGRLSMPTTGEPVPGVLGFRLKDGNIAHFLQLPCGIVLGVEDRHMYGVVKPTPWPTSVFI